MLFSAQYRHTLLLDERTLFFALRLKKDLKTVSPKIFYAPTLPIDYVFGLLQITSGLGIRK